jgi:hypothetical protein
MLTGKNTLYKGGIINTQVCYTIMLISCIIHIYFFGELNCLHTNLLRASKSENGPCKTQ